MTDQQTGRLVAALDARWVEPRAEFVDELGQRIREEAASSAVSPIVWTDNPRESVATNLVVHFEQQPDGSDTHPDQNRWFTVGIAVAATILVVAGAVFLADRDSDDVGNDPVASPTVTVPSVTARADDPDPEVTDRQGCVMPTVWSQVCDATSFDDAQMNAVTAGGPGLVAVGTKNQDCCYADFHYSSREDLSDDWDTDSVSDGVVWTSVDGLSWTRVPHDESVFGGPGGQQMFDVIAGGPGLVAVGRDGPGIDREGHAAAWTSGDGLTWTRVPHDESVFGGPGEQRMVSVTVGGPGLVAVGRDGPVGNEQGDAAVWTSADGLTWLRVPHDEAVFGGEDRQRMLSVTPGGPGLVAVGSDGLPADRDNIESAADAAVWTSVDGLTWSRAPHDETALGGPGEQQMNSVTVGGPGLVAVGSASKKDFDDDGTDDPAFVNHDAAVWTSVDGLTWTRAPHDEAVFAVSNTWGDLTEIMLSVTAGGPGLVAVGFDSADQCGWEAAAWTSPDGLTWSQVPNESTCGGEGSYEQMYSVTDGAFGLIAVGWEHDGVGAAAVWNG